MKKIVSTLLIIFMIMIMCSSCTEASSETTSDIQLYYVSTVFNEDNLGLTLETETMEYTSEEQLDVGTIIEQMITGPESGANIRSPIYKIDLVNWDVEENIASLTFSAGYGELQGLEHTLADACITLTLLQLDYLNGVIVTWIGNDEPEEIMTEQSFSLSQEWGTETEQEITLYYLGSDGRYLVSESQILVVEESEPIERYVIEELIRGPKNEAYRTLIPEGTEVLNVYTEKGTCYVDLSEAFLTGRSGDSLTNRLAVYSIVNSITNLKNVERVQILVNGETVERYGLMDISTPLVREERTIADSQNVYNTRDISVFVHYNGTDCVTEMPLWVMQGEYSSIEQLVMETILYMEMPQGCVKLFPDDLEVVSIAVRSGVCYVDMTSELLDYRDEEIMRYSIYAVVASLTNLDNIDAVVFNVANERITDAPFDISGQFTADDVIVG